MWRFILALVCALFVLAFPYAQQPPFGTTAVPPPPTELRPFSIAGGGTVTGPILFPNGSASAPSIAFSAEPTLGIRRFSSGNMGVVGGNFSVGAAAPTSNFSVEGTNLAAGQNPIYNTSRVGQLNIATTNAQAVDVGGTLSMGGLNDSGGSVGAFAAISGRKENGTNGNWGGYFTIETADNAAATMVQRVRVDSTGIAGASAFTRTAVLSADYTVLRTDMVIAVTSLNTNAAITITLPSPTTLALGKVYIVKDESGFLSAGTNSIYVSGTIHQQTGTTAFVGAYQTSRYISGGATGSRSWFAW